eukprot:Pgem_evm1s14452
MTRVYIYENNTLFTKQPILGLDEGYDITFEAANLQLLKQDDNGIDSSIKPEFKEISFTR